LPAGFPSPDEDELAHRLVELCINPKIAIEFSAGALTKERNQSPKMLGEALRKFQDQYEAKAKANFVTTSIGREIFETLDHALAI
jgi:hypothetical protein